MIHPKDADTPCKRLYLAVQLTYLSRTPLQQEKAFFALAEELMREVPSTMPFVAKISERVLAGNYYQALKAARELLGYEQELLAAAA